MPVINSREILLIRPLISVNFKASSFQRRLESSPSFTNKTVDWVPAVAGTTAHYLIAGSISIAFPFAPGLKLAGAGSEVSKGKCTVLIQ